MFPGGRHNVWTSTRRRPLSRGLHRSDRLLEWDEEPAFGAHLLTPRLGYTHHGIYVGAGRVVHYSSCAEHWPRGEVEEVSFGSFSHGRPVWVRPRSTQFDTEEVIE